MARSSVIRRVAPLFFAMTALGVAACAGDDGVGSESADVDSFASPTNHGVLQFGVPNAAEFTDSNRFHAWTFELSAEADVDLSTQLITQNLDSVMYLYKKGESGWGSNIKKNDDHDGQLSSRITATLGEGEYLVKIKAAKTALRGAFSLTGQCAGAGCPEAVGGECATPSPDLPSTSGFTTACAQTFYDIVTTPAGPAPESCNALEEAAVGYYKDYWDDIYSYEEMSGGEEPYTSITHHPGVGTVVGVDLGGDEDSMNYVFDMAGKLIYYYQHNQSPDWSWFCVGGTAVEEPDEDCAIEVIFNQDYSAQDVEEGQGVHPAGETPQLDPAIAAAIREYETSQTVGNGDDVNYAYKLWASNYENGAEVTLSAENRPEITYVVVGDPQYGMTIALQSDDNGTSFLCKEL